MPLARCVSSPHVASCRGRDWCCLLPSQVRRNKAQIDMPVVLEAMEKIKLGLRHQPLPPSDAKRRMATLLAARAVSRPPPVHSPSSDRSADAYPGHACVCHQADSSC